MKQYERYYSWLVGWRPPVMIGAKYNSHSGLASAMICSGHWESNVADRMQKFRLTHGWRWSSEWELAPSESKDGWTYATKANGDYLPVCVSVNMHLSTPHVLADQIALSKFPSSCVGKKSGAE